MQGRKFRVALYWTPLRDDPLWTAGNTWLGRDPELGVLVPQPRLPGIAEITSAPRQYGFHATLRPPMRLSTGWEEFLGAAEGIAAERADFKLPRLELIILGGFLALGLAAVCPELRQLADRCVAATDLHRLRPDAAELAKRRRSGLSAAEDAMLLRWGYPYVMEYWRFHMTLSRRLSAAELATFYPAAARHFAHALSQSRSIASIAIFTQATSDAIQPPFLIGKRLPLRVAG